MELDNVTEDQLTETEALGLELGYTPTEIRYEFGEDDIIRELERIRSENNFDDSFCF